MTARREIDIRPQPGPQHAFCASRADIAIYGGAAGAGKTWALVFEASRNHRVPGFAGVIFRRTYTQIVGGGSIWTEAERLYPQLGGIPKQQSLTWKFQPNGSIEFRHLQHESDKFNYLGREWAFQGWDEITQFTAGQFWYLLSRARSTSGVRPYIRATCNPDPDSFVRDLISWWIDDASGLAIPERSGVLRWFLREGDDLHWADHPGELRERYPHLIAPDGSGPMSLTFVPATLDDNPALISRDPSYRSRLMSLPRVERERLLGGNWNVRASAGSFFRRAWFDVVEQPPLERDLVTVVRAWDKAATIPSAENPDPDWTRGVKMGLRRDGSIIVLHVESLRGTPHQVEAAMLRTAKLDGVRVRIGLWQDPGQAGKSDVANLQRVLQGYRVESEPQVRDKALYAGPYSSYVERGLVQLARGVWNDAYVSELESFPRGGHDDQVDASSRAFRMLSGVAAEGYAVEDGSHQGYWPGRNDDDDERGAY